MRIGIHKVSHVYYDFFMKYILDSSTRMCVLHNVVYRIKFDTLCKFHKLKNLLYVCKIMSRTVKIYIFGVKKYEDIVFSFSLSCE